MSGDCVSNHSSDGIQFHRRNGCQGKAPPGPVVAAALWAAYVKTQSDQGMTLLSPGDAAEAAAMTRWAQQYDGPVYLRLTRNAGPDLPAGELTPGALRVLRTGDGPLLVSTGGETSRVLVAAEILAAEGIDVTVAHAPWLKPFDAGGLVALCRGVPFVVTVEEREVAGGLGGLVAETLSASQWPRRVHRIGLDDTWVETGSDEWVLETHGLSAPAVAARVAQWGHEVS